MTVAVVSILVVTLLPFLPVPLDFEPEAYNVTLPKFEGPLAPNDFLDHAKILFHHQLRGPESFAVKDGLIYTGTQFGHIYQIDPVKETITKVANTGSDCEGLHDEERCGRVLGLRFAPSGELYATDAYKGLVKIDVKTGKVNVLVKVGEYVGSSKLLFPDDLDIDDDGVIYYSQASTRWGLHQIVYIIMEHDNTGRILTYDTKTKRSDVLKENLYFPNGLQLSKDRTALLFSELLSKHVMKYELEGPNKGKVSVFSENLPGDCDNIRLTNRGTYWVAIGVARSADNPTILDSIAPFPLIAKTIMRFCWLLGQALESLNKFIKYDTIRDLSADFTHGKILLKMAREGGVIVELGDNGQILRSLHSSNYTLFSEVMEYDKNLYIGSFIKPYLLRVPVPSS